MRVRRKALLLGVVLGLSLAAGTALAAQEMFQGFPVVKVLVNGKPIQSDVPAVNFHGRTMLPIRAIAEALGAQVAWDAETSTVTLTTAATAQPAAPGAPLVQFKGSGQSASPTFQLPAGAYVMKMTHNGRRNFAVVVQTTGGDYVGLMANTIGAFDGSKVLVIEQGGKFIMDITADGDWTIAISQAE